MIKSLYSTLCMKSSRNDRKWRSWKLKQRVSRLHTCEYLDEQNYKVITINYKIISQLQLDANAGWIVQLPDSGISLITMGTNLKHQQMHPKCIAIACTAQSKPGQFVYVLVPAEWLDSRTVT